MVTRAEPGGHCAAWEGDPHGRGPRASVGLVLRKWVEAGTLLGSVGLRVGELSSQRNLTVSYGAVARGARPQGGGQTGVAPADVEHSACVRLCCVSCEIAYLILTSTLWRGL